MIVKASPGGDIAEIVPRSGGQLSTVFEVRRTAADPLIVKIYGPEWAWKQAKEVDVYTTWQVNGFIDVENAIAADPLMDLAKTECYSIWSNADKLAGLVAGYGELPADWRERTTLYRLYHSLELWDWFKSIGTVDPLDSIAGDLAAIVRS